MDRTTLEMAKLNRDQALEGLKKLYALTRETATITRKELQRQTGLRLTDMLVLTENGILACSSRRPCKWVWVPDAIPNMEMAKKMLATKVKAWDNRPEKTVGPNSSEDEVKSTDVDHPDVVPGVKVYKTYEITKQYGVDVYSMTLRESPEGWDHTLPTGELDNASADMLRAVGSALVVAAAIMDGKGV